MARRTRPIAVHATPAHWRLPTLRPKPRSARTARKTRPPAMTGWTIESGAIAIAPTWRTHAPTATSMPIANHLDAKRPLALRQGWRMSTVGAQHAPRCFHRKPRFVAKAQKSASNMPSCTVKRRGEAGGAGRQCPRTLYAHLSALSGRDLTLETWNRTFLDKRHRTPQVR